MATPTAAAGKKKQAHFHVYKGKKGWSWRLMINGAIIAVPGESFTRRRAAVRSTVRVTQYSKDGRLWTRVDEPPKPKRPVKLKPARRVGGIRRPKRSR